MALAPTGDGYSTMYYHPLSSGMEFSVTTRFLRDPQRVSVAGMFEKNYAWRETDNGYT